MMTILLVGWACTIFGFLLCGVLRASRDEKQ